MKGVADASSRSGAGAAGVGGVLCVTFAWRAGCRARRARRTGLARRGRGRVAARGAGFFGATAVAGFARVSGGGVGGCAVVGVAGSTEGGGGAAAGVAAAAASDGSVWGPASEPASDQDRVAAAGRRRTLSSARPESPAGRRPPHARSRTRAHRSPRGRAPQFPHSAGAAGRRRLRVSSDPRYLDPALLAPDRPAAAQAAAEGR